MLRVTGLCMGNSPETGEFPAQMASNAENVSIWWRHHDVIIKGSEIPINKARLKIGFWKLLPDLSLTDELINDALYLSCNIGVV